jgi:hypothetical protein
VKGEVIDLGDQRAVVHHRRHVGADAAVNVGSVGPDQAKTAQADAVKPGRQLPHHSHVLNRIQLRPFDAVPVGFVQWRQHAELEPAGDAAVVGQRGDHLDPLVFRRDGDLAAAHPRRDRPHHVQHQQVGDPLLIEVGDGGPQLLEPRARIDAVVVGPVEDRRVGVVVGRLPIAVLDHHAPDPGAELIDQQIEAWPQLPVVPARGVGARAEPVDYLISLRTVNGER